MPPLIPISAGVPMTVLLSRPILRDWVLALSESRLHKKGHFNPQFVQHMLEHHQNGKAHFRKELLGVLNLQLWNDLFVQGCRP